MKIKHILAVLGCLAITANTYAGNTSSFTGLKKGTSWDEFVDQMEKDSTKLSTFGQTLVSGISNPIYTTINVGLGTGTTMEVTDHLTAGAVDALSPGYVLISGNTSGGFKTTVAAATAFLVTATVPAQTVGAAAITYPDFGGVADEYTFKTKSQTIANKTFTAPVIAGGMTASGSASNDLSASTGTFKTSSGLTTISGGEVRSTDALSGAGAVSVTKCVTKLTTTGSAQAITLADGVDGQVKTIVHDVDGGSAVLTPATKTGFTTITFTAVGESATLVFVTTRGWIILSIVGAVAA